MKIKISLLILLFCGSTLAVNPDSRASFLKGYNLMQDKQYYSAIETFKETLADSSYPLLDYCYFYIAQCYQQKHDYPEAIQVYQGVIGNFKDSVLLTQALMGLSESQAAIKDYEKACLTLRALIDQFPKDENVPLARYRLGQYLAQTGNYEEASRAYRNLDLFHPDSDLAEKALEQLDQLAKKSPLAHYEAPAASVYNLGVKYFKAGNNNKAKEYFSRVAKYYKNSSYYDEANIMLGRIYLKKGNLKTAEKYFKKAINLAKDSKPEAMYYLARNMSYEDKLESAIYVLEKLVETYPDHHIADDALFYIGYYQRKLGNNQAATEAFNKLITNYSHSDYYVQGLWYTGNGFYKDEDYASAYDLFSRAISLPPADELDRLTFWAAKSADKIGNRDKAVELYKITISRFDHSYYGYRSREELSALGIEIKPNAVPEVKQAIEKIDGDSVLTASHEAKYQELMALELGDEAAIEAALLVEKLPPNKKDKARIAEYNAYVIKGKFTKPIHFADKKINEAMQHGSLADLDPRIWRFAYPRGYWEYVNKYANKHNVDPYLVYAVIREESRFKSQAVSSASARGLMQIMPGTGRKIAPAIGISYSRWKLHDPRVNIEMGSYYLSQTIKRFNGNVFLALAGYNGGPNRVAKWKKQYADFDLDVFVEDIPLSETRNYVKKVMKSYYGYKRVYGDG